MKKTLNFNDTVEAVREIINSVGVDFIYSNSEAYGEQEACLYVYGDKPSCIVGRFLVDVEGHDAFALTDVEGSNVEGAMEVLGYNMYDEQTRDAIAWLLRLQEEQDHPGTSWGQAFAAAQEAAKGWDLSY